MNLITLSNNVHDKPASVQFLQQRNILHHPRICVNGHPMVLRCNRRDCRTELSVRKGSYMARRFETLLPRYLECGVFRSVFLNLCF